MERGTQIVGKFSELTKKMVEVRCICGVTKRGEGEGPS